MKPSALWSVSNCIYLLLALLLFCLPFSAPLSTGILIIASALALYDRWREGPIVGRVPVKLERLLWVLFLGSGLSVLLSLNVRQSALNWLWIVTQLAACCYLYRRYAGGKRGIFLLKVFLTGAGVIALYGLVQYLCGLGVQDPTWVDREVFHNLRRAYATMENPNLLGTFLVMAIAYCVGVFPSLEGGRSRCALLALFLLSCACLLVTFSRGNWVALFWVLVLFSVSYYPKARLPLALSTIAALAVCWKYIAQRFLSIFTTTADTSVALRISYLESSLSMITEHPFGVGWYGYQFAFPDYDFYLQNPNVIMYHSHNMFTTIGAELGLIGLAVFCYTLYSFFSLALELRHTQQERWVRGFGAGYIAALLGICVSSLTDYTLYSVQLGMLWWSTNGMLLGFYDEGRRGSRVEG